jgi:tetratricopeptide (TPR) repeat protein
LPLHRKALLIRAKALGPDHPHTAASYNNVAGCLHAQGKAADALPLYRQALLIKEKVLGVDHPSTATTYDNVAACLEDQGKAAEALPLYRQALLIRAKILGPDHPHTALNYNNVAGCLQAQGKAAEALPLFRQALRIWEKVRGPNHPHTAASYNNVAGCLQAQGKAAEALPLYRQALLICEKVFGPDHPHTSHSYHNVAYCLHAQGKAADALPLYRQALRIYEKVLGPDHPHTAQCYNNMAVCLEAQGKAADALPLYRQALLIRAKVLGPDHPHTANTYNNVAYCLWRQGRRREAVLLWQQSVRPQEAARAMRADSGFDRAQGGMDGIAVQAALAVALAQFKQPVNAFGHAEASLARGLLDDLAGLSHSQRQRAADLRLQMARVEPILASFASRQELTGAQKARQEAAKREYARLWREWAELFASASADAVLPLKRIQKGIPDDAALLLWVEELDQRWGCVVRSRGAPIWQKLKRTTADAKQAQELYAALTDPSSNDRQRARLLAAFGKERLEPLRPHLKGVKRLFVVPTGAMAYIPADLLAAGFAVRYVPSGSLLARIAASHRVLASTALLAVGDPTFDRAPPAEPPASGVFVQTVLPRSFAAQAGLQAGDVLLSVGATKLQSIDDLQRALSALPATAQVWREGRTLAVRLQGSALGVVLDKRAARVAVVAHRQQREAVAQRGTGHKRLPGTRLEVEAIAALVPGSVRLLGSAASEQRLDALRAGGRLTGYRLLHLATHGEADDQVPRRSALILAQDALPDPAEQVKADKHPYDGRLTVARIRADWALDADLVVLSACETALGKQARGDGLLGFAQAFLSRGARSVVLSRWKVDDTATALLMVRFYENLLGKRQGLKQAFGRAAALDEAKQWLRTLPRKEAERLATLHTGGVLRGTEGTAKTPAKGKRIVYRADTPFAHPYYWAAFTLIGDPD